MMTTGTSVSFDYDNTLIRYEYVKDETGNIIDAVYREPHLGNIRLMQQLANDGYRVIIVTAREKGLSFPKHDKSPKPEELVEALRLPVDDIYYTANSCKIDTLMENNATLHFDDCEAQCLDMLKHKQKTGLGPLPILVDAPRGINNFLKRKFKKLIEERNERSS